VLEPAEPGHPEFVRATRPLVAAASPASFAVMMSPSVHAEGAPGTAGGGAGTGGGGSGEGGSSGVPPQHPKGAGGLRAWASGERVIREVLRVVAFIPLVALVILVVILVVKALPAIRFNGLGFLTHNPWRPGNFYANPVTTKGVPHPPAASYGALPLITGTLESSLVAMVIAMPVGVGTAILVVEKLPVRLSSAVGFCLEVLVGIPSVVYGLWGALTFGPFLARDISPFISDHIPDVPVLSFFKGPVGAGEGLFTSGVVLAIMILPIVAATTRDLLRQVPRQTVEGALALGMTDSEAMHNVSFPWVRSGVIGASVLGLGRALGETMAIAMVSGTVLGANAHDFYSTMTTIAATIVSQLDSALTDSTGLAVRTLAEAALVLLLITLVVNVLARLLVRRVSTTALPVGRGI